MQIEEISVHFDTGVFLILQIPLVAAVLTCCWRHPGASTQARQCHREHRPAVFSDQGQLSHHNGSLPPGSGTAVETHGFRHAISCLHRWECLSKTNNSWSIPLFCACANHAFAFATLTPMAPGTRLVTAQSYPSHHTRVATGFCRQTLHRQVIQPFYSALRYPLHSRGRVIL